MKNESPISVPALRATSETLQTQVAANAIAVEGYRMATRQLRAFLDAGLRAVPLDADGLEGLELMKASTEALGFAATEYAKALGELARALTGDAS